MTNPCTCKAEHWQPHADSCPAKPAKTHTVYSTGRLFMDGAYTDENEWVKRKDYDIVRGNLSLAEDGLANYALEVEAARRTSEYWKAEHLAGNEEIEQLKTTLFEAQQAVLREGIEVGRLQAESDAWDKLSLVQLHKENERLKGVIAGMIQGLKDADAEAREHGHEPLSPQAPIAKITIKESGAGHYAPDDVSVSLYAPGLPPGEHDLYCDPSAPSAAGHFSPEASGRLPAEASGPATVGAGPHCPSCLCDLGSCPQHPGAIFHPPQGCPECASGEPAYALVEGVPSQKSRVVEESGPDDPPTRY